MPSVGNGREIKDLAENQSELRTWSVGEKRAFGRRRWEFGWRRRDGWDPAGAGVYGE